MGRKGFSTYSKEWSPADYTVDSKGKVQGGYTPPGRSNWGRWGEDDQRGAANLTTAEHVRSAAGLVKRGRIFSLALPLDASSPLMPGRAPAKHYFMNTGSDAVVGSPYNEHAPGFTYNDDSVELATHGSTQWDGLAHVQAEDTLYNGNWAGNVTAAAGASVLGIGNMRESFIGRGVLLDVARLKGVDWLEAGTAITPEDLDAVCEAQGVTVGAGDVVIIRTGYLARWWALPEGERDRWFGEGEPGCGSACIDWIADRDLAAVAADNVGFEVMPMEDPESRVLPVHQALIVDLGVTIGELWVLNELAEDCAADGVYEFLLVAPTLYLPTAVGSPLNPIAIK
jgi:kynurenine formamidase